MRRESLQHHPFGVDHNPGSCRSFVADQEHDCELEEKINAFCFHQNSDEPHADDGDNILVRHELAS